MTEALLCARNVTKRFGGLSAVNDVSLDLWQGAIHAVIGPNGAGKSTLTHLLSGDLGPTTGTVMLAGNGAGKSTLFKALVGLLPLASGRIMIHGEPLGNHKDCVAYIPQREEVDWRFPVTVNDVVAMGRFDRQGWVRTASADDKRIIQRSLEQLGIGDLKNRSISELSGGQQQRVFLARALAQEPHILLMDEPFTGVDVTTQETTLNLLDDLRAAQVTAMISTHDLSLAAAKFDLIILLNHRLVAFGKPSEVLQRGPLAEAFGPQMLVFPDGTIMVDDHG